MDDKKIIEHAKNYLDQMAEGINPLTGKEEPYDSCLQQVRISRCLQYVSGLLQKMLDGELVEAEKELPALIDEMEYDYLPPPEEMEELPAEPAVEEPAAQAPVKKPVKLPFSLTAEQIALVQPLRKNVSLGKFLDHIYDYIDPEAVKKPNRKHVEEWLIGQGVLESNDGKLTHTEKGKEIGIEFRSDAFYPGIYYSPEAQIWLIERLPEVIEYLDSFSRKVTIDPETGEIIIRKSSSGGKTPFTISEEKLDEVPVFPGYMSISKFVAQINGFIDTDTTAKLQNNLITNWLVQKGYLRENDTDRKPKLLPTEEGNALGIIYDRRNGPNGEYWGVFYDETARAFILQHLYEIIG